MIRYSGKLTTGTVPMKNNALLVFVRNAIKGKVKTRLAASIGEHKALLAYQALLAQTQRTSAAVQMQRYVYYSDRIPAPEEEWPSDLFNTRVQSGRDLGERMHHAFLQTLKSHSKALLVGSDIPGLTPEIIRQACSSLSFFDAVVGPAEDGGYYLLGLKKPCPQLFSNMEWSHPQVLAETLTRLQQLRMTTTLLPTLRDVDDVNDWNEAIKAFPQLGNDFTLLLNSRIDGSSDPDDGTHDQQ